MIEHWYAALAADVGVVVHTDDPVKCKARLYKARTEAQDPDLNAISIVQSPVDANELWLVKKRPEPNAPET